MLSPAPRSGQQFIFAVLEDTTHAVLLFAEGCGDGLTVQFVQRGFVVQQIAAGRPAVLEQKDDLACFASSIGQSGGQWLQRIDLCVGFEGLQREGPETESGAGGDKRATADSCVLHTDFPDSPISTGGI